MIPDQMRIAVAESLGWTPFSEHKNPNFWFAPNERTKELCRTHRLPNFLADLNTMHEAERTVISAEEQNKYQNEIASICYADEERANNQLIFNQLTATAIQRCEAYLRVKGLWKEDAK